MARKTSGSSCVRTGFPTASSKATTTSSITAATPGTLSSISPGKLCPSRYVIGLSSVTQSEDWYYISAFGDLRDKKTGGIFAGISIPLGKSTFASTGFTQTRQGTNFTADAGKSIEAEVGSYGWRVHDSEGTSTDRGAMGTYRASIAEVQGNVWQRPGSAGGSLQASGAVATMGGGIFL